jgi:N-acyl-D-aspartate/D-glutamate deacylase
MKGELRSPNPSEIDEMVGMVETALEEGAVGFSTGLEYLPGSMARPEEIFPLLAVTQRYNALYETHVRNRDVCYDLGFAEALAAARITGVRLQIAHIQPKFGAPDRAMEHTLEMIHWARESGADVCFDIFPHDWNHTGVSTALPPWAFEGGIDRLLSRLNDPKERQKMKYNPKPVWQLVAAGKWNDIVLFRSQKNKDLIGLTFEEIGRRRKVDPHEAVFDLLLEEGEDLYDLMWTSHSFSEADVRLCLKQPQCIVASDTMALAPYGLLKDTIGSLIGYGWTAQLFQKYVREESVIKLEGAVYKLTGLPAQRLGLRDRGGLYPGAMADVVVFDPDTIENLATLAKPTRYPCGIEYVMVNGQTVIEKGKRTKTNPGKVIRRTV